MKSKIQLYKDLPLIDGNYIIDDIDNYLNQFNATSITKDIDIVFINEFNDVLLNFDLSILNELYQYNYAKITSNNYQTGYYFINAIERVANNNLKFSLELDVLNTYQNLEFYSNTTVKREHIDRWNYDGFYYNKEKNKIYLLRNFIKEQDEPQPLSLIDSFSFYSDTSSALLDSNYWVKININDQSDNKEGLKIYFLNLYYNFSIMSGDLFTVKALTSYSYKDIAVICQTAGTVMNWSLVPYCPHPLLKNVGENDLVISTDTDFLKVFDLGTLEFSDEKGNKHIFYGVATNFYGSLINLKKLETPLYKIANENNQFYFTEFLYKILIQEINDAENFIKNVKNNILFENGVFSNNHNEERDINNFYQTNEPSTLKNNNFKLNLIFDKFINHNLILENIKLKKNIDIVQFYNEFKSDNVFKNLILLPYFKIFYDEEGGSFVINNSNYFYYQGYKKKSHKIKFFGYLPLLTNNAIEFEQEAELRRLENNQNKEEIKQDEAITNNPSIFKRSMNFISDKVQIAQDFIKKNVPKNIRQGVKRGINAIIRSGNPLRALGSASTGLLFNQEYENNKNSMANTSFESFITNNEYKLELDVSINQKMNTLADLFYYNGNLVNVNKVPTHNNRKYFDFLQCEPIFKTKIYASTDIKDKIIGLFNIGVYYIHKTTSSQNKDQWVFPFENVENLENKLISLL